jgi:hypothetical protein
MRSTLTALRQDLENMKARVSAPKEPHIIFDETGLRFKLNHPMAKQYDPFDNSEVGTFVDFHNDKSMVKGMMGGFGSGKSTCCCANIPIFMYNTMPPMKDGVRRARGAIIRNTMGELESTTLKTWNSWFNNDAIGMYLGAKKPHIRRKPNLIYNHIYYDNKGRCELELFCIGLDLETSKSKLESNEFTFFYINEGQHVPRGVFTHAIGRLGRYPAPDDVTDRDYYTFLMFDTNPPNTHHWMHEDFDSKNKIEGNKLFHQPPGLIKNKDKKWVNNPHADNFKHLINNYYYNMARANGFSEQYIKTTCNGEYGFSKEGKPVYPEYNDDIHSAEIVELLEDLPVVIGVDGGSTPAALVQQLSPAGQMLCIKEFTTHFSSARSLKENLVLPWVLNNLDKDQKVLIVCDPSMCKPNENIEVSAMQIWEDPRWEVITAKSNYITPRTEAQKAFLNKMVGEPAQPAFQLSRTECPMLREAMISKYKYVEVKGKNDGTTKDIPEKTHPHSDIADCGQYGALEFMGDGLRIAKSTVNPNLFINREKF